MGALAPLLITSLSQSTGETLVALGQLRNYCGTRRYQRRFVQRIAPYLVRPPDHASIWCLRHQNDIESIIAAVEMILMNASEVFSMGWYELGQSMLTDTRRAESLRTAANQLCQLNSPSNTMTSDGGGGLLVGLSSSTPGSSFGLRRSFLGGGRKEGGISIISNDSLAEWEVMAIDKGIRQSVLDVFSRDWGRISTLNLSTKDDAAFGSRASRRGVGISSVKSKEWDTGSAASGGGGTIGPSSSSQVISGMAAASITKSPRSTHSKLPLSPRNTTSAVQLPSADALESTFGPSFSSQDEVEEGENRSTSPLPTAPLSPRRDVTSKRLASEAPKTPPTLYQEARGGSGAGAGADNDSRISSSHPPQHSSPGRSSLDPPLSPQSSIGAGSTSTIGTHKSTNQMSSTTTREQYRALTSTSVDRKRTVAACRALRAQITQFEDAFAQIHGRTPKGAAERAPLASTYMQYREWKRAIRADAACRIQALCRGARLRMVLSQSDDLAKTRFILKQQRARKSRSSSSSPKPLNHLRIPLDMDGGGDDGADSGGLSLTRLETRSAASQRGEDDSVEVFPVQPKWRDRPQRSSSSSNRSQLQQQQQQQQQSPSGGGSSSPRAASSHSSPHRSSRRSSSSSSLPDVSVMSLAELQQRKRELKQQLKLYDMNFHKQHGRMPEKREKEPIRHLYESYNAYKSHITIIEKGEAQPGPGTAAFRGVTEAAASAAAPPSPPVPDIVSPTHVASPPDSPPNQPGHFRRTSSGENSYGTDSMVMSASQSEANTAAPAPSEVSPSQDLASLKAEKGTLHQMLRSYEKDFFKQHKRQVSSFADIRPVAGQYRRYKEIKKAIAQKTMSTPDA